MDSRNSFAAPNAVRPHPFSGASWKDGAIQLTLPAKSLVVLELSGGGRSIALYRRLRFASAIAGGR